MRFRRYVATILLLFAFSAGAVALPGCDEDPLQEDPFEEGPVEEGAEEVEEGLEEVKEGVEEGVEELSE